MHESPVIARVKLALFLRILAHHELLTVDEKREEALAWSAALEESVFVARAKEERFDTIPLALHAMHRLLEVPSPDGMVIVPEMLLRRLIDHLQATYFSVLETPHG